METSQNLAVEGGDDAYPLKNWLERPVLVYTGTWAEGATFDNTIDVFSLWVTKVAMSNKLAGFANIAFDMDIRVQVNGSPMQYGALTCRWIALYDANSKRQYGPVLYRHLGLGTTGTAMDLAALSTRPGFYLDVADCQSGEIYVPFFYPKPFLSLVASVGAAERTTYGRLILTSVSALSSCGGNVGVPVNVSVWVSMKNVRLSGCTQRAAQSGPISGPFSLAASALKAVSSVAATASHASSVVAGVARSVGLCNDDKTESVMPVSSKKCIGMASAQTGQVVDDTSLTGASLSIERYSGSISEVCAVPGYIGNFTWGSSVNSGTNIYASFVCPTLGTRYAVTNTAPTRTGTTVFGQLCPMGYFAMMFGRWRGDITFKFSVICSANHRGKLRIWFEPGYNTTGAGPSEAYVQSVILDLSQTREVEVTVPYSASSTFLNVAGKARWDSAASAPGIMTSTGGSIAGYDPSCINGVITATVLNELLSPVTSTDVTVMVHAYSRNMHFTDPYVPSVANTGHAQFCQATDFERATIYQAQSGSAGQETKKDILPELRTAGGELIDNFYDILHRPNFYSHIHTFGDLTFTNDFLLQHILPIAPQCRGIVSSSDAGKPNVTPNLIQINPSGSAIVNASFVSTTVTALNYIAACFLGYKGSIRWYLYTPRNLNHHLVSRYPIPPSPAALGVSAIDYSRVINATGENVFNNWTTLLSEPGIGCSQTYDKEISVNFHDYSTVNFKSTSDFWSAHKSSNSDLGQSLGLDPNDTEFFTSMKVYSYSDTARPADLLMAASVSAGTDFSLIGFIGTPTLVFSSLGASSQVPLYFVH